MKESRSGQVSGTALFLCPYGKLVPIAICPNASWLMNHILLINLFKPLNHSFPDH
jgi:hypothetical protein